MQEKIKVLTIGDCQNSTLENYFKDNENIEFLGLALNENTEKLNNKLSNRNVVFLRSEEDNLEKLLEIRKVLKEKEIITVTILEEKFVIENKEILEKSFNTIFPITRKDDIENLLSELIKMIDDVIYGNGFINLDIEDVKSILKDLGISIFGSFNINKSISKEEILKNINYPFYNKTLKDSKKSFIFLDTLDDFILTEAELITDVLRNETSKKTEDIFFSIRMGNSLKNRVECSFIAGIFKEREEKEVSKEIVNDETEDIFKVLGKFFKE